MRNRRLMALSALCMLAVASPTYGAMNAPRQGVPQLVRDVRAAVSTAPATPGYAHNTITEPHLAVNPRNSKHLVAAYQMGRGDGAVEHGAAVSFDSGFTWTGKSLDLARTRPDQTTRVTDPVVAFGTGNNVYISSINLDSPLPLGEPVVQHSADGGRTFSAARPVTPSTGSDRLGGLALQDKLWITVDTVTGAGHRPGRIYATWLAFPVGVLAAYSDDHGLTWSTAAPVYSPGYGPIPIVLPGGDLGIISNSGALGDVTTGDPVPTHAGPDTIFIIRARGAGSAPTGAVLQFDLPVTITEPHGKTRGQRVAGNGGETDSAHLPSAAVDGKGRLAVVVDDNRFRTEPHDGGFTPGSPVTDPVIFFSNDLGQTWSQAQRVPGGDAPYLNRFLSTVAGLPGGGFAVSWRQRQEAADMARASDLQDTYVSIGRPAPGVNTQRMRWTSPLRVNGPRTQVSAAPRAQGELFLGDYQGLAASKHGVHIARPEAMFGPDESSTSALYVATVRY